MPAPVARGGHGGEPVRGGAQPRLVLVVAVDDVVPGTADDDVAAAAAHEDVGRCIPHHGVVAESADEPFAVLDGMDAGASVLSTMAAVACDVAAQRRLGHRRSGEHAVVAAFAVGDVGAGTAFDQVVAVVGVELVAAGEALQAVGGRRAEDRPMGRIALAIVVQRCPGPELRRIGGGLGGGVEVDGHFQMRLVRRDARRIDQLRRQLQRLVDVDILVGDEAERHLPRSLLDEEVELAVRAEDEFVSREQDLEARRRRRRQGGKRCAGRLHRRRRAGRP